jgi:hypothetical protein
MGRPDGGRRQPGARFGVALRGLAGREGRKGGFSESRPVVNVSRASASTEALLPHQHQFCTKVGKPPKGPQARSPSAKVLPPGWSSSSAPAARWSTSASARLRRSGPRVARSSRQRCSASAPTPAPRRWKGCSAMRQSCRRAATAAVRSQHDQSFLSKISATQHHRVPNENLAPRCRDENCRPAPPRPPARRRCAWVSPEGAGAAMATRLAAERLRRRALLLVALGLLALSCTKAQSNPKGLAAKAGPGPTTYFAPWTVPAPPLGTPAEPPPAVM